ncbi:MAG: Diaminopimelate decarboxylase [Planctomycetes bacterium ADurb.Bin126]|nr:MAG: Diaminopimelate decarboxylase [Planctomycetes bacterium ADurb.Bin126]HOD82381.1 diaminopimelate decarboxylase [Phycisphaerae bacterium]HQL73422.1 diaminopimelate decarboxylase [Phycisphaerae bacterium]
MDFFEYRNGELFCEDVAVADIAAKAGTPVYIYSAATLLHHYRAIEQAFAELKPLICYSIKSLANLSVLRLLAQAGSGFDVVSGGEIARALAAGGDPSKIVYAGVGKTDREIREAIAAGIGTFNVESEAEFENLARLAAEAKRTVHAALRVNPDVDPKTHRYTTTGKKETKFGVDIERAERFFDRYGRDEFARLDAIHLHIGSPIYSADPYVEAIRKTLDLIARLRDKGFSVTALDIGGGFGADYEEHRSPAAVQYAQQIVPLLRGSGLAIILEPGRQISCNSGLLVTQVQYVKQGGERNFVIVDAAMTDLIRPALYEAQHFIYPVRLGEGVPVPQRKMDFAPPAGTKVDVVGGVCESSDFLAKDRVLPPAGRGDLLAVFSAGAYGFVMASQYNSRPRPPEVLVEGDAWRIVRRRETYEDLMAGE